MQRILLPVVATLALAAGCYSEAEVGTGYSYGYASASPNLYYVSPGVQVVAYSDYPVFYSDNYYWRYDNGLWYRSNYYGGGWVAWNDVPYSVRSIDRPYAYSHFTPGQGWSGGATARGGVDVRDHRYYQPAPAPAARTYGPGPDVRDHRAYAPAPAAPAPDVRDHRAYSPGPAPVARPAPGPVVRDHRR